MFCLHESKHPSIPKLRTRTILRRHSPTPIHSYAVTMQVRETVFNIKPCIFQFFFQNAGSFFRFRFRTKDHRSCLKLFCSQLKLVHKLIQSRFHCLLFFPFKK